MRHLMAAPSCPGRSLSRILIAASVLLAAACSEGSRYDTGTAQDFLKGCMQLSSRSYCHCALSVIESRMDQTQYLQVEQQMLQSRQIPPPLQETLQVVARQCRP